MASKNWFRTYVGSLAVVAVAVAVRRLVHPLVGDYFPLATLFGAVAVAVWMAGYRAAIVAAIVGYLAIDFVFVVPLDDFEFWSSANLIGFALYCFSCSLIILVGEAMRRARRETQITTDQLQIVTEGIAAGVTRCSRDLRYLWANQPYCDWIQLPAEQLIGRPIAQVVGEEAFAELLPYFTRVLAGETVHYEREVTFLNIGPSWLSVTYTPTRDELGKVDGWVAVVIDIGERKRIEQALQDADRRKDEFIAVLSHELRNPLAPIGYAAEILKKEDPTRAQVEKVREVIDRQVRLMGRLLDDLMDVSRITRGTISLRKQPVELRAVVNEAVEATRPMIEQSGHTLAISIPDDPVMLNADATRISQVLMNLLNNAAKYTEHGGRIELSAARDGESAVIRVKDTGVGIPADMLPRIFELFAQDERSIERSRGGLGIGLNLAQSLVGLHGGTLEAKSDGPGRGSEFVVRLPAEREERAGAARISTETTPADEPLRILVVDDNEDSAESMAMFLSMNGHEVRTAHDGLTAVAEEESFHPAAVLLDIGLPGLNGYEAAQRIRAKRGDRVVLVAVTGWGQEEDRRRSRQAGFDHHLTKPVELDGLRRVLSAARTHAPGP